MTYEEAVEWLDGKRSTANLIPPDPAETWLVRVAQADAACTQQAYWIWNAHFDNPPKGIKEIDMPCNSDYMEATTFERDLSRVACLLDELSGKKWKESYWDGYHPLVYSATVDDGDALVAKLCAALQKRDVTQCSLEMQIWWRDHQAADKARIKRDLKKTKKAADRKVALAKLTAYERELLGF